MKYQYSVTGLHCDTCADRVRWALQTSPGVVAFELDPVNASVMITVDGLEMNEVHFDRLQKRLRAAGGYQLVNPIPFISNRERFIRQLPIYGAFLIAALFAVARGLAVGGLSGLTAESILYDFLGASLLIFGVAKIATWRSFMKALPRTDFFARQIRKYGSLLPLLQIFVGVSYLARLRPDIMHWILLVTLFSSVVGMLRPLRLKELATCLCFGTLFDIPLGWSLFYTRLATFIATAWLIAAS